MKNRRIYRLTTIFGSLLIILGMWFGRYKILKISYRLRHDDSGADALIKKYEKTILEDREALSKYEVFKPSLGKSDAGIFLNSKLHWKIGDIHHQGSLALPDFVHKEMNKDWVTRKPLFKKMGLDFNWMKELLKYDYWNPEENSPAFPLGKKYFTYSFPIPTYRDLMTWAKLRLLYGKETKDTQSAFKEVRHLARLVWTNDYLVSNLIAVNMLKLENDFHEILLPEEEGNWQLIPEDVLMRGKRYFYGVPNFVNVDLSDEMFRKMTSTDVGLCSMIVEGLMSYVTMRDMMKEELAHQYARFGDLVKSSENKCRKSIVHKMWEDPTWPSFLNDEQDGYLYITDHKILGEPVSWKQLKENDDIKVIVGYILNSTGTTNYLTGYKE